jgi:hypothetical protein
MLRNNRVIWIGILDIEGYEIAFKQRQSAKGARCPVSQNHVCDFKPSVAYACRREGNSSTCRFRRRGTQRTCVAKGGRSRTQYALLQDALRRICQIRTPFRSSNTDIELQTRGLSMPRTSTDPAPHPLLIEECVIGIVAETTAPTIQRPKINSTHGSSNHCVAATQSPPFGWSVGR